MMTWKIVISAPAKADIQEIWWRGFERYNQQIADDYDRLIKQSLLDLSQDPYRVGSRKVENRNDGLYKYRIEFSKVNIEAQIKKPAHAIFYFTIKENIVAIARIMRDVRELEISKINRKRSIQNIHTTEQNPDENVS